MRRDRWAFGIALSLFVTWVGWLSWQAMHVARPTIVSSAQLAVAQYDVECDLVGNTPSPDVEIRSVRWSIDQNPPTGRIRIENLKQCQGYVGTGTYLVPLVRRGEGYWVAGLPLDPGGRPNLGSEGPRIYPITPSVLRQWEELRGQAGREVR